MPRNLATEDVLSVSISASLQPLKWYSIYFNASVDNQKYKADYGGNKTINAQFTSFNLYGQHTFKLPINLLLNYPDGITQEAFGVGRTRPRRKDR